MLRYPAVVPVLIVLPLLAIAALTAGETAAATTQARALAATIPAAAYVSVKDGHLARGGERVRFWSVTGHMPPQPDLEGPDPYHNNIRLAKRLKQMGCNMVRLWQMDERYEQQKGIYAKGDFSRLDLLDHFLKTLSDEGIAVWAAGAGGGTLTTVDDVALVDDPASAAAWAEAVRSQSKEHKRYAGNGMISHFSMAHMWDERLERADIRNLTAFHDHINRHSGLRWGDDPNIAVWELINEQWWIVSMLGGRWQDEAPFFRKRLLERWQEFLRRKYGSPAALLKKWGGLLDGEDLDRGSVLLAPMQEPRPPVALQADTNEEAYAKFKANVQPYGRADFNRHRGSDVLEFFAGLLVSHKQRVLAALKKTGRSTANAPWVADTGIGYNTICQYMHQECGDAVSHCAYINGWTADTGHQRYPWFSGLEEPPRICTGVPWLENNTVAGKPYFVYETQMGSPSKYRSEFPYRLLFLAAVQDWDIVSWHNIEDYYHTPKGQTKKDDPYVGPLTFPGRGAYQFSFTHDEVQFSAFRAAAAAFTGGLLKPAASPTTFVFGRRTLFDPAMMDYGASYGEVGQDMLPTSYRYGSRLKLDPTREDDQVIGPIVREVGWAHPNPLRPTPEMAYNWNLGHLLLDAPGIATFTGFAARHPGTSIVFRNGVTISDITVNNPAGSPYPVADDEKYVSISVVSEDGKPLATCTRALISAVSTSFNTGLVIETSLTDRHHRGGGQLKVTKPGTLPVLVTRVGCRIQAKAITGMQYVMRTFSMREISRGVVQDGTLIIPDNQPVFVVELSR